MNKNEMNLNAIKKLKRALSRTKLRWFIQYVFPEFDCQWFHHLICKSVDRLIDGEYDKLMIFVPPQCGKSEIVSRKLPAYLLGKNPDYKIVSASYSHDLSAGFNRAVQRIMEIPEYLQLFPNTRLNQKRTVTDTRLNYLRNSNEFEIVDHFGKYKCVGVCGSLTGNTCDIGIIDDPVKDSIEANSETYRKRTWEWYNDVFMTRLHNDSKQIICQTRWHEDDLSGRILSKERDKWKVISLPGIKEDNDNKYDPRSIGEALWEEKHSAKSYFDMKQNSERTFTSLIQQRPAPAEGALFLEKWFKTYQSAPSFEKVIQSWDCTFKDESDSDYVAGTIWGITGTFMYLIGLYHGKWDFVKTCHMILMARKSFPNTSTVLVEDKANGPAIISSLRKKVPGIVAITPDGGKYSRAYASTDYFEAGNIFFPDERIADWICTVKAELKMFPNAKNDDIVDSVSQAINYHYNKFNSWSGHVVI
jgi:predicted phage terminase large subunit-like protein